MSSPLIPVIAGTNWPPVSVVVSFCLKSPPITDGVILVWPANRPIACLTTFSLSPPAQYQSAVSLLDDPPDEHPATPAPAAAAAIIALSTDLRVALIEAPSHRPPSRERF